MSEKAQITADMTIAEIFSKFPQHSQRLQQTITNAGLHCVGCNAATWETLEAGMLGHGYNQTDLEGLLKKLNAVLSEQFDLSTITVTPRAVKKFREVAEEEGLPEAALRFGDMAGGCGGFEYILDFSEAAEEDDAVMESNGLSIHIKKGMVKRLLGSVIDYVDGLQGAGFKITNPNVKTSCGCGKSQGY